MASTLLVGLAFAGAAQSTCRVTLPFADWQVTHINFVAEYRCRSERCGGEDYLLRFDDSMLMPGGPSFQSLAKGRRGSLKFDGMYGERIEDSHGRRHHINESYFGDRRTLGFYSEGMSKKRVRENFKLLKSSAKCW